MLGFIGDHLTFIEGDILKRLVRLYQKDKVNDIQNILHELNYLIPKTRTLEETIDLVQDWTDLTTRHEMKPVDNGWEVYWNTRIPYEAFNYIKALALNSQDKLDLIGFQLRAKHGV